MKERITPAQLNSLTEQEKINLREWWVPKLGDMFIHEENPNDVLIVNKVLDKKYGRLEPFILSIHPHRGLIERRFNKCLPLLSIGQMLDMIKTCDSDCLCDQLFNKVKLILSK